MQHPRKHALPTPAIKKFRLTIKKVDHSQRMIRCNIRPTNSSQHDTLVHRHQCTHRWSVYNTLSPFPKHTTAQHTRPSTVAHKETSTRHTPHLSKVCSNQVSQPVSQTLEPGMTHHTPHKHQSQSQIKLQSVSRTTYHIPSKTNFYSLGEAHRVAH